MLYVDPTGPPATMERLTCKCAQCKANLGQFINLWTKVGKSYYSPIIDPAETRGISAKGQTRSGEQNTLVEGWYVFLHYVLPLFVSKCGLRDFKL